MKKATNSQLATGLKIYMVGIGGSGMSGLALVLKKMGFEVTGSDLKETATIESLRRAGIAVHQGHRASHVPGDTDLVSFSSAVDVKKNPEIRRARKLGISCLRRGSLLAQISRLKKSITVSGAHGKTTTSSMIGWILERAGFHPTIIVGGEIRNFHTNALLGIGDMFVMETDESDGSFLETHPWLGVVTNIDNDHLEHYGSTARLKKAFLEHLSSVPFYGRAILCKDDPIIAREIIPKIKMPFVTYGTQSSSDFRARDLRRETLGYSFSIESQNRRLVKVTLQIPGLHNVRNALAAAVSSHLAGAPWDKIAKALGEYRGIRRRLEVLGRHKGVVFLDDYGHHPTEIKVTLDAVVDFYTFKRLLVCFQPHRYSRTKMLWRDFGPALKKADFVWVCPIYAASEKPIPGVSSDLILESLNKAGIASARFPGRTHEVLKELRDGDLFLTLGAGDVWKIGEDLLRRL